ncbi:MAG: fasciclin domain-containing protein, partial [Bacteroidales bacterium]|nr:fasciclin domain-containing protein [Bacteroidales bacterium]
MVQNMISDNDFKIITGLTRKENDAHLFGIKIIKKDITCKNGYLNILEKVMIPPVNMAEYIGTNSNTSIFADVMNRFCAPYFDSENTIRYRQLNPSFGDSIFVKRYFARIGGINRYPSGQAVPTDMLLPFDPGWNSYIRLAQGHALQSDMAAMFVPTNEAMNQYLNSGSGAVLKDRFKSWDSIPNDILPSLIKRHMRTSFIESVPSRFATMVDEDNSVLPVKEADIVRTYIGTNGVVYETNKVYPPDDYISVYGPVLLSANDVSNVNKTKVWRWAITQNDFRLY